MNNTDISNGYIQNNPQGAKLSKYVLVIWLGVLLSIIIATYCSYLCTRSRSPSHSRLSSTNRSYSITTITTTGNNPMPREGINENTLMHYPKFLYSEARLHHKRTTAGGCSICLADYIGSDTIRILPDCGHIFHLNCIDPWLRMHATCPICRTPPGPTPLATPLAEVVPLAILRS